MKTSRQPLKTIDQTIEQIYDEKLSGVQDRVVVNGWMQLQSLITHIKSMVKELDQGSMSQSVVAVRYLVRCFVRFAYHHFDAICTCLEGEHVVDENPGSRIYQQHRILERLCSDWETLRSLLDAVKEPHARVLEVLVCAAQPSEYRSNYVTIPYFGRQFSLVGFKYAPLVFVTGIPLYNLETPWDWQVVWHEMAGHVVRQLRADNRLPDLPGHVWQAWKDAYKIAWDDEKARGLAWGGPSVPGVRKNLISRVHTWVSSRVWGILRVLRRGSPAVGWIWQKKTAWLEELAEDMIAAASLGPAMLLTLKSVLRQHYEQDKMLKDDRHPPPEVRLAIVDALLEELQKRMQRSSESNEPKDTTRELRNEVARILLDKLVEVKAIRKVFDRELASKCQELQDSLCREEPVKTVYAKFISASNIEEVSVPALIAAARLVFHDHPQKARYIAETVKSVIDRGADRIIQVRDIELPSEEDVENLVKEGIDELPKEQRLQALLEKRYQEVDLATPEGHTHPHGTIPLSFTSYDGVYHNITHYSH